VLRRSGNERERVGHERESWWAALNFYAASLLAVRVVVFFLLTTRQI
jgi:hypothetical protein